MCNFKNRRTDSLTERYRIAKTPRMKAQHNIESWKKIEKYMSKRGKSHPNGLSAPFVPL
jgi:hypothetical protein